MVTGNEDVSTLPLPESSPPSLSSGSDEEATGCKCRNLFNSTAWKELCKGYDFAASRLIAAVWAFVVPLAARPSGGCPSEGDSCWNYVGFLGLYVTCLTITLPACSVVLINHCSSRALDMGKLGLPIRRRYYQQAQIILLQSLGTTYGVAHSQLAMATIRQLAYSGSHFVEAGAAVDPYQHIRINVTTGWVIESVDVSPVDDAIDFEESNELFVQDRGIQEMRWGILGSFCIGFGYFCFAVLSISGVSAACTCSEWSLEAYGCSCSQSPYLIELSLLLQNSWYYVCGYTWAVFWTYVWFGWLLTSEEVSPRNILILDLLRALLLSGCFSFVAIRILPFRASDMNPTAGDTSSRIRLLVFRSTAILVVIALADLPSCFITKYLAHDDILGLSSADQLRYLFATAATGFLILPRIDTCLSRANPPTVKNCFWREVLQWLVGILCFAPWLASVTALTTGLRDTVHENIGIVVVSNVLLGIILTMAIAFISGILNGARDLTTIRWSDVVRTIQGQHYLELTTSSSSQEALSATAQETSCAEEDDKNAHRGDDYLDVFEGLTPDGRVTYVL